jgi:hypothetical protein
MPPTVFIASNHSAISRRRAFCTIGFTQSHRSVMPDRRLYGRPDFRFGGLAVSRKASSSGVMSST